MLQNEMLFIVPPNSLSNGMTKIIWIANMRWDVLLLALPESFTSPKLNLNQNQQAKPEHHSNHSIIITYQIKRVIEELGMYGSTAACIAASQLQGTHFDTEHGLLLYGT